MAIFGTRLTESYGGNLETFDMMPTMEASDAALYEFAHDIYKVQAGMYVADIMIEQQVLEGASLDTDTLLESVFTDMFKKIKDALNKLWAKIKSWFASIKKNLEIFFMEGSKFVKKYKTELETKAKSATRYSYTGYKYNITGIDTLTQAVMNETKANLKDVKGVSSDTLDGYEKAFGKIGELDSEDFTTMIIKPRTNHGLTVSDLKEELMFIGRGKSDEQEQFTNFNGNSVSDMISFVTGYSQALSKIESDKKTTDESFNNLIKGYNDLEKSLKDSPINGISTLINKVTTNAKICLTINQSCASCRQALYKEAFGTYVRALKGLMYYKPAKEGFAPDSDESTGGILETAMKFV